MTDTPEFDETRSEDFEIDLGPDVADEAPADEVEIDLGLDEAEAEDPADAIVLTDEDPTDEDEDSEVDDATAAALAELREELSTKFGDWYVVHTYSGMENRVKQNLDNRVKALNMEDYIFETIVPTEDVVEIRNNARKTASVGAFSLECEPASATLPSADA